VPYASSKFALEAASEVLAQELRPFGIRVAIIEPGVIQTHIWENSAPATHLNRTSPYRSVMRRNGRFYARMLKNPSRPELVADAIFDAVTRETPRLRTLVGQDAEAMAAGRARMTDEEWIGLCDEMTDEEYSARFRRYFGLEV
jgi:NAD(P)-dependent dehydrogenase (short-subunit alcohol dehydrogenase family)